MSFEADFTGGGHTSGFKSAAKGTVMLTSSEKLFSCGTDDAKTPPELHFLLIPFPHIPSCMLRRDSELRVEEKTNIEKAL